MNPSDIPLRGADQTSGGLVIEPFDIFLCRLTGPPEEARDS